MLRRRPRRRARRSSLTKLTPFLLFADGNCAEAMAFYQSCFGGELEVSRNGDKVAHARLHGGAIDFSATDWAHPTRAPRQGNTVAMYLDGGAELRPIFDRLAEGGDPQLRDELREMPFGLYGHLADKYGVHWFFVSRS